MRSASRPCPRRRASTCSAPCSSRPSHDRPGGPGFTPHAPFPVARGHLAPVPFSVALFYPAIIHRVEKRPVTIFIGDDGGVPRWWALASLTRWPHFGESGGS